MKNIHVKSFVKLMAVILVAVFVAAVFPICVSAGEYTSTVNLLDVRKNTSGDGFYWDNKTDTLTLTNFVVNTKDRYGLRIPDGATIVLEGTNTITAAYAALDIEGSAYLRGEGTLILNGGEVGFINPLNMDDRKVIVESGNYVINSDGIGVLSPYVTWSQTGGKIEINSKGEAVNGREIRLQGGIFKANNSVHATSRLSVAYATLEINSENAALISDKNLSVNGVSILSNGNKSTEYNGEKSITTTPLSKKRTTSMLFGKSVPIIADYAVAVLAICAVAAIIIVPKVIKKKKLREAIARYEAEQQAAKEAKKNA